MSFLKTARKIAVYRATEKRPKDCKGDKFDFKEKIEMKNTKKGFTLVELLVVIAILAILATVSVVGYTSFIQKANDSNAATELHQVVTYLESELLVDKSFDVVTTTKSGESTVNQYKYVITNNGTTLTVARYSWNATNSKWGTTADEAGEGETIDLNAALKAISDFSELNGTFSISNFEITYTYGEGKGTASEIITLR